MCVCVCAKYVQWSGVCCDLSLQETFQNEFTSGDGKPGKPHPLRPPIHSVYIHVLYRLVKVYLS